MSDLADRVEETRELIEPNWTPERESRVRGAVLADRVGRALSAIRSPPRTVCDL